MNLSLTGRGHGQLNRSRNDAFRMKRTVLHVIASLGSGGAESTLLRVVTATAEYEHVVMSLTAGGINAGRLRRAGVEVCDLGLPRGGISIASLRTLFAAVRDRAPLVVQTWMYHSDLIGGLLARMSGHTGVVWGVRNGYVNAQTMPLRTRLVVRACAKLSRVIPYAIVAPSEASVREHCAIGYARDRFRLIPNGYDTETLKPDAAVRETARRALGIAPDVRLIGMVGRWDPQKDHRTLLHALRGLVVLAPEAPWHCTLIGPGMTGDNAELVSLVKSAMLSDRVSLAGSSDDIQATMNALDVHVLSSRGESFPNVVAEAMACGTPVIATDVGDAADIVGDTGWIVPARSPEPLAAALRESMTLMDDSHAWHRRQRAARQRIGSKFSLVSMADAYRGVWESVGRR
jgi:glycosyltransferase involved in cell wall biosynthesis